MFHKNGLTMSLLAILLTACAAPAPTPTLTPLTPTVTSIPTAISTTLPSATATATSTNTPIPTTTSPAATPTSLADGYLLLGRQMNAGSDYANAIAQFDQAIKLNPNLAEAYLVRGLATVKLIAANKTIANSDKQMLDGASTDLDQAVKLDPALAPRIVQSAEFNRNLYNRGFLIKTIGFSNQDQVAKDIAIAHFRVLVKLTADQALQQLIQQQLRELGEQ